MTARHDLIIFDCDGVLIDSEPIASRTLAEELSEAGLPMSQQTALELFTGKSETDIRADLFERGLEDYDSFALAWRDRLYRAFATDLRPMQGIVELVERLDAPICVASNSTHHRLQRSLGTTVLWPQFAPRVYSAEDVPRPKPFPDLVLHCLASCKAQPDRSIMIDDSSHGVRAALEAGVTPIGFVDPRDPRPGRRQILRDAGAT